ncbi:hypothetical protein [Ruegeria arenilitoris]|uniref:hypothetical protein n=1 Tax=Ruegeria arenilitoris TaxID=1173585 RepID=UPI00147A3B34|nr:hypothetical protein [Ruegeria arenilitoris]
MNIDRTLKYLLVVGVSSFLWWLGATDETAFGLKPSDLNSFAGPLFIFFLLFGYVAFFVSLILPYLLVVGATAVLIAWWNVGQKWRWSSARVSLVLAGAATAFSLLTGIGRPLQFALTAILIVIFVTRIKGRPVYRWIDAFGKVEVIFLTIAVIWLLPDWNWDRIDQRDQSLRTEADVPTYTTRYTREMNKTAMDAAARFPDPQSCLVDGKENRQSPKSLRIDWTKVRQSSEAEVCIFRVLSALGGIKSSRIFMEAQGFSMRPDSFSPENPYVERRDGALRVSASWSIRNNGPKFPTRGVWDRIRASVPYGMSINVYFSQDGNSVLAVQIGYNTL